MALVAFDGTPLIPIGFPSHNARLITPNNTNTVQDAANEAVHMLGQLFWTDGGSHTVDTTGSSSLGFRTGAVTFANAGTTFNVGLAAVDTATGPPGRAANATDVVTYDVVWSGVGGAGGITANAWLEKVPTSGTKTIAHGAIIAFVTQMTARAGADSIITVTNACDVGPTFPFITAFIGGAYSASSAVPNAVVTASDGTLGFFFGSGARSTTTTQTWNNGSATVEYGNIITAPVPLKIYGMSAVLSAGGNVDLVLYSDPLGTPVAQATVSIDLNVIGAASVNQTTVVMFSTPYTTTASQPLGAIVKPTSVTNVSVPYITMNAAAHQQAWSPYTGTYAINRASGAFAAQNTSKDRFAVGLLVGAFDAGGSGGGISRARAAAGF